MDMNLEESRGVVAKIYDMINDPTTDSIISWNQNRTSFIVWDQQKLTEDVLPRVFGYNFFPRVIGYDRFQYFIDMLSCGYGIERVRDSVHKYEFAMGDLCMDCKILDTRVKKMMMVKSQMMKRKISGDEVETFLEDVYDMVDESCSDSVITWTKSGKSFIILDPQEFAKVVLPRFLFYDDFDRFTRMLNVYGFMKIDPVLWEFARNGFVRGTRPQLVKKISRVDLKGVRKIVIRKKKQLSKIAVEALKEHINALHI